VSLNEVVDETFSLYIILSQLKQVRQLYSKWIARHGSQCLGQTIEVIKDIGHDANRTISCPL